MEKGKQNKNGNEGIKRTNSTGNAEEKKKETQSQLKVRAIEL